MRLGGRLSRRINRLCGGLPNETICARLARVYGDYALSCRVIDSVMGKDHCRNERLDYRIDCLIRRLKNPGE